MKPLHKILFSFILGAGLLNAQKADLIVTNGKITTMDDKIRKFRQLPSKTIKFSRQERMSKS
ncbi:hypothetical protein [Chryseobacterium oranimense]|uniref:hypothetical protein n=1 Tax=Chryseobacterium oranimense TaxID=421058 RepID=UPI001E3A697F|nr:hypothetical protein [Chryseobacterium oranimense]